MNTETERGDLPSSSNMERRVCCPGSGNAEAKFPEDPAGELAARGAAIHLAMQTGDDSELEITDKVVRERLSKIEGEALEQWVKQFSITDFEIVREKRFWIRQSDLTPRASAQVDFAAISQDHVHALIVDAKSGFLDTTPAEINWQLKTQVVALWCELVKPQYIRAAISAGRRGSKYDPVDYNIVDIRQAFHELLFYGKLNANPDAPRIPGTWCRYCRAKADCPEAVNYGMMPTIAMTPALGRTVKADIAKRIGMLSIEALAFIKSRKTFTENIFEAVDARLKSLTPEELQSVGLQLEPSAPQRKISDAQAAFALLAANGLITAEEFRTLCKVPVGALEAFVVPFIQAKLSLTAEAAKKKFNEIMAPAITKEPRSPSLKPISVTPPKKGKETT